MDAEHVEVKSPTNLQAPRRRSADVRVVATTLRHRQAKTVERKIKLDEAIDQRLRIHCAHSPRNTTASSVIAEALGKYLNVHGRGTRQLRNLDSVAESLAADESAA